MQQSKKFGEYTRRDDFEIQLFVVDELSENQGYYFLDKRLAFPGVLKKEGAVTNLYIATWPIKKEDTDQAIVIDNSSRLRSHKDGFIFAQSWDGKLTFVFDRFVFNNAQSNNGSIGKSEYSKFKVLEYRIGDNWSFSDEIENISLRMDYLEGWHGKTERTDCDDSRDKTIYKIKCEETEIELSFIYGTNINHQYATGSTLPNIPLVNREEKRSTSIGLSFSHAISVETAVRLAKQISQLLSLLIGRKTDVIQLKMNSAKNNHFGSDEIVESPDEMRTDSMLVYFSDVDGDAFQQILSSWFGSAKIRNLVNALLTCNYFGMPTSVQLTTLVSAIETFYNEAKFDEVESEFVKKVQQNAYHGNKLTTLGKLASLIDELPEVRCSYSFAFDGEGSAENFIRIIKDSRVYFAHGNEKEHSITNEFDLIVPIQKLKAIIHYTLLKKLGVSERILLMKFGDIFQQIKGMTVL